MRRDWELEDLIACWTLDEEEFALLANKSGATVLCLRILQAALVYINTLMLQDVLADQEWAKLLKPADQRGLTPLFWQHVQPYGEVRLDVAKRLSLGGRSDTAQGEDRESDSTCVASSASVP